MLCDYCGKRAVYKQRYSGKTLCENHFVEDFERRALRTIRKYGMINKGDKIIVALSGGKDSSSLLFFLNKYKESLGIDLIAVTIDEGIKGYRDETIKIAKELTKRLNVKHLVISFKDKFGFRIDELNENHCDYCGVFRRRILNDVAKEENANKIATGHNLDDETQVILLNFIRSNIYNFIRLRKKRVEEFIPRIKPFMEIPEKEIVLYALINDIEIPEIECPYVGGVLRYKIARFINELEEQTPGIKFSILRMYEKILPYIEKLDRGKVYKCNICGNPSSRKICKGCELLSRINKIKI